MTRLYIVRHAESEMNERQDLVGGRSNHVNLSAKGERQAKAFGQWMRQTNFRPDVVFASPARRTIQTLNHSFEAARMDIDGYIVEPRIQELSQGIMEGTSRAEAYNDAVRAQIAIEQLDFKFEDGESIAMVMNRMLDFAHDAALKYPNKTILAYGHGFSTRALAGAIKKLPHDEIVFGIATPNVSLSLFEITPESKDLTYIGKRVIDEESI